MLGSAVMNTEEERRNCLPMGQRTYLVQFSFLFFDVKMLKKKNPLAIYLGEVYSYKQVNRELFLAC